MNASAALSAEYSSIARDYATQWSPVIRPMALPLLHALSLENARTVVDIGTGTGALLPDLRAAAPRARVIGIDRAEGMVHIARDMDQPLVVVSDASELCIRDAAVDIAVLIFTLFHLPDPVACLREVARTFKRDAQLGIVCWGIDPGVPGAKIWTEELDRAGAGPDPRDPSVVQVGRMNTPEKLTQLLKDAGFSDASVWSEKFSHRWTAEDLLPFQLACGVASRRLPHLDAATRERCTSAVRDRLSLLRADELDYRPEVLFAVATADHRLPEA